MNTRSDLAPWFLLAPKISLLLAVCSMGTVGAQAPSPSLPDQSRFLQQVRSTLQGVRLLQSQYAYREKRTDVRLNDHGEVIGRSVKVFDRNVVLERVKQIEHESQSQRERRLRNEAEERRKENEIIDEAFCVYDFHMVGRERLDGYDAILFTIVPTSGFVPRTSEGKLLQKFSGRAWVAESDSQLIRVEVEAIDDVSMGFGFLARFYKGSHVVFQRRQVTDAVWLPSELRYSGGGRVLLVKKLWVEGVREYSDYKKSSVDILAALSQPRPGR